MATVTDVVLLSLSQNAFFGGMLCTLVTVTRPAHSASWSVVAAARVCEAWCAESRGEVQRGSLTAFSTTLVTAIDAMWVTTVDDKLTL